MFPSRSVDKWFKRQIQGPATCIRSSPLWLRLGVGGCRGDKSCYSSDLSCVVYYCWDCIWNKQCSLSEYLLKSLVCQGCGSQKRPTFREPANQPRDLFSPHSFLTLNHHLHISVRGDTTEIHPPQQKWSSSILEVKFFPNSLERETRMSPEWSCPLV